MQQHKKTSRADDSYTGGLVFKNPSNFIQIFSPPLAFLHENLWQRR
jgi:hypothetical protein